MSEFNFNMDVNTSLRLLTGGKYCDRDIVITVQEEPETGVTVAKIGNTEYKSVAKALANAVSGDTVLMVADSDESGKTLVIPVGVTLDIASYSLTADYIYGLNNSKLGGTTNSGKVIVTKGNLTLAETPYNDGSYDVVPIWDNINGYYLLSKFKINTDGSSSGLYVNDTAFRFVFLHQATGAINRGLLNDGASNNEIEIVLEMAWLRDGLKQKYEVLYSDYLVSQVATNNKTYAYNWPDYSAVISDYNTFEITGVIRSKTGAISRGVTWNKDNAKPLTE